MGKEVTKTITQLNDATGWLSPTYKNPSGKLDISIEVSSDWSGTIALQKTRDGGDTVKEVSTFTGDVETTIEDHADNVEFRLICTVFAAGEAEAALYR